MNRAALPAERPSSIMLADDIETPRSHGPYAPFSSTYMHFGDTLANRLAELNRKTSYKEELRAWKLTACPIGDFSTNFSTTLARSL